MTNMEKKEPKIFLGIGEIAGYYTNLKHGLDELGIKSYLFKIDANPFKYGEKNKKDSWYTRLVRYIAYSKLKVLYRHRTIEDYLWMLLLIFLLFPVRFYLFIWAVINCNVFVFHGKSSFFECWDLPIYRFLKKKIIWIFHGSDSRPLYLSGKTISKEYGTSVNKIVPLIRRQKETVKKIEKYASIIIDHPPSSQFHEKPFIPFLLIGIPTISNDIAKSISATTKSGVTRIVHAPSMPECKGTQIFRNLINKYKEKGYPIEYVEIIDKPNIEVLEALASCDFVLDELYSDTTLAGLATEAAYFGKPTLVCGYANYTDMMQPIFRDLIPPSFYCHPETLDKVFEKLLTDKELLEMTGRKVKSFIENYWKPSIIAEKFMKLVNDDFPKDWLYDPRDIKYTGGWGLSEEKLISMLTDIVSIYGIKALQISDKPALEKLFQNKIKRNAK
jgi:hypothetical protein